MDNQKRTPSDEKMHTLRSTLAQMQKEIAAALPRHVTQERFLRIFLTTIRRNPKLLECGTLSVIGAMMAAAQDGLELDGVHAALVPFKDKQGKPQATYMPMFRGLIALARRSGDVSSVRARPVYEGDTFEYEDGLNPKLRHIRGDSEDDDDIFAFYAIVEFKDGTKQFEVMSRAKVEKIRNGSKGYQFDPNGSPWTTNFPEMGCKTVARRVLKWAPMSAEVQRSIDRDEAAERHGMAALASGTEPLALPEGQEYVQIPTEEPSEPSLADQVRARTRRVTTSVAKPRPGGKPGPVDPPDQPPLPDGPPPAGDDQGVIPGI
jgi:recombination protein RecT